MNKITSSSLQFQPPKLVLVWILHLLAKIICNFNFVDCKTQNSVAFVVAFFSTLLPDADCPAVHDIFTLLSGCRVISY